MTEGAVYLLHFDRPLKEQAQHYLGWTSNLEERLEAHRKGNGSRLMAAVQRAGISFQVVRIWHGSRKLEKRLKKLRDESGLCPFCQEKRREQKRAYKKIILALRNKGVI